MIGTKNTHLNGFFSAAAAAAYILFSYVGRPEYKSIFNKMEHKVF